ncbi:MAG: response regulator [Pirellulales bacterium]
MYTVLDVGNCRPDHASIKLMLESNFAVRVLQAHNATDTFSILGSEQIDLVLINRKLDEDYSDGIEILKQIKADGKFSKVPVMLVTNYEEHQAQAISLGAIRGFGKLSLNNPVTHQRIAEALQVV